MVSVGRGRGRVHFRVRRRCWQAASFIKKSHPEEQPKEIGDCVRLSHQPSAQHTRGAEYSRPEQCNAARFGSGTVDVKRFGMNPANRSAVRVDELDTASPGSCGEPPRCRKHGQCSGTCNASSGREYNAHRPCRLSSCYSTNDLLRKTSPKTHELPRPSQKKAS